MRKVVTGQGGSAVSAVRGCNLGIIEATPEETETRLLHGLRKRCPALYETLSLKDTLTALRRGQDIADGKTVLIVLDQFEQWLHAKKEEVNTDVVQALRQCDGGRQQCIVMVRDDFWLAVSRFLRELVVRLAQEGKVICVRLALFSEMIKGKLWSPATLKEVGGTEGVGVTFLEETFCATKADPNQLPAIVKKLDAS